MKAYLTFVRKNKDYIHLLGIKNPANILSLKDIDLLSGQPIVVVMEEDIIKSSYILEENGELLQIYGTIDYLFQSDNLTDLSTINLKKYNYIRNILISSFSCLSIDELDYFYFDLIEIENVIFHNYLHLNIDLYNIKNGIIRVLNRCDLRKDIKDRIIKELLDQRHYKRKMLRKKIDVDLSGYRININTFVL